MRKKWIKWMLVLIWMFVIFLFSSQKGQQSSHNNRFIVDMLKYVGVNLDIILGSKDNYIIRKLAHMTEYFILYQLVYNAIYERFRFSKTLVLSLVFTFLYACSDEYHQSFVPGRSPAFIDVLIDTVGGTIAFMYRLVSNWRQVNT